MKQNKKFIKTIQEKKYQDLLSLGNEEYQRILDLGI